MQNLAQYQRLQQCLNYTHQYISAFNKIFIFNISPQKVKQQRPQMEMNNKFQSRTADNKIFLDLRKCIGQNKSHNVCLNDSCIKDPLICLQYECKCQNNHFACMQSRVAHLVSKVQIKIIPLQPYILKINKYFDKAIDMLSDMRQQILNTLNNQFKLQGLSSEQKYFMNYINKLEDKCFKGKNMNEVYSSLQNKPIQKSIQKHLQKFIDTHVVNQFNIIIAKLKSSLETNNYQSSNQSESDQDQDQILKMNNTIKDTIDDTIMNSFGDLNLQPRKYDIICDRQIGMISYVERDQIPNVNIQSLPKNINRSQLNVSRQQRTEAIISQKNKKKTRKDYKRLLRKQRQRNSLGQLQFKI